MSSKWNERLVISFLTAYKQHPCLWNPYHKDYYNCREKNEALQKIIEDLGVPGFTVTDYLHQIKSIREKYKEEQTRTIKSLKLQKQYKSPFSWYNIVADMLMKVIDDEEKAHQRSTASILRSLSSGNVKNSQKKDKIGTEGKAVKIRLYNNATYDQISRRSKSVEKPFRLGGKCSPTEKAPIIKEKSEKRIRYVPCPQFRSRRDDSRDEGEDALSSYRPTRDTDSGVLEYPAPIPSTSMDPKSIEASSLTRRSDKSYEEPFLKCPLCGWQDAKYERTERNEGRNHVSCSGYNKNLSSGIYSSCAGCDKVTRDDLPYRSLAVTDLSEYTKKQIDNSGDFDILQESKQTIDAYLRKKTLEIEKLKSHVDTAVQFSENLNKPLKEDIPTAPAATTQPQVVQVDPTIATKLQYGTIEASTQLKITLTEPKKDLESDKPPLVTERIYRNNQAVQGAKPESSTKETQFSYRSCVPESVNTVNYVDKGVQNTICISDGSKRCVSLQTINQNEQKENRDEYHGKDATASKEMGVNVVDHVSVGVQSTGCVSRGNLARCMSSEKTVDVGTTISMHKVYSIGCITGQSVEQFKSKLVQCVPKEKFLSLTRSKSFDSIKRCVRDTDLNRAVDKESMHPCIKSVAVRQNDVAQEFEAPCTTDTCSMNILNLTKEDPAVASALQQLLRSILFQYKNGAQNERSNGKIDRSCLINATEMVNAIEEYTTRMLHPSITKDDSKEFYQQFNAEFLHEDKRTPNLVDAETSTIRDSKLTMTEESMFESAFQSTGMKNNKEPGITENDTLPLEKFTRKFSAIDKETYVKCDSKNVGTNGSSMQLSIRDAEIQSSPKLLKDSACFVKYEQDLGERVSVGTQKRDPILVRVIKCKESQAVVRSDKETFTDTDFEGKRTSKRIATCGRVTCTPPTVCRTSTETKLESTFPKEYKKQMVNDYCRRAVAFKDQICDQSCKAKLSYDWTDVMNADVFSNVTNSKIPMCVRPRKYSYAKSK